MASMGHKNVKKTRYGSSLLRKVSEKRDRNEKFELKWNSRGQAIGENRIIFMNYIGMCTRVKVDINIVRWKRVPKEIKESIWTDISGVFEVPADKHKWVLSIAGRRWCDFKTSLTKKWVYDNDGNVCPNPPLAYPFIDQETWDQFLDSRLSDEFKEQSDKHREIAKKILYPYRGSRKGYAGIEEEMILANEGKINPELSLDASSPTSIPRSLLWKKARIGKDGNMVESVRQVVAKIDSLSQQATEGEISLSGRQDILTAALGNGEHPGRVRGVGQGVTLTQYFGREARAKVPPQFVERLSTMETQMEDLKHMLAELQGSKGMQLIEPCEEFPPIPSATASYPEPSEVVPPPPSDTTIYMDPPFPEGWTQCSLASSEPGNPIVALGKVFNTNGIQPVTLHNKPLEPGYMRVTVIEAMVQDAPLPLPSDEAQTVFDAIGIFVAWPKNLIFRNTPVLQLSSRNKDDGMTKQNGIDQPEVVAVTPKSQSGLLKFIIRSAKASQLSKETDSVRNEKIQSNKSAEVTTMTSTESRDDSTVSQQRLLPPQVSVRQQQKLTTLAMKLMYRCTRGMTQHDTVTIGMPLAIMHHEQNIQITKEEILQWLFQEDIRASHVSVYIKYLFDFSQESGTLEMFGFLRPQIISLDANPDDGKIPYIMEAMKGARKNQIFFAPFNIGRHWVLCAIQPHQGRTYWLDPAQREVHPGIKKAVQTAIRTFFTRRKKRPYNTKWYEIKCPRQANEVDCGYYILRYMHEIIQRGLDHIPEEYYDDTPAPGAYEQHHMDETRDKWIELVQNHMD